MLMMSEPESQCREDNKLIHVSGREALQLLNAGAVMVDVRPEYELGRLFDVEHVLYCPYDEISNHIVDLPPDQSLIIADAVGLRSKEVAGFLMENGFTEVYNLAGGIVDWDRGGYPVTTDKTRIMTGSCMCQLKYRHKKP